MTHLKNYVMLPDWQSNFEEFIITSFCPVHLHLLSGWYKPGG